MSKTWDRLFDNLIFRGLLDVVIFVLLFAPGFFQAQKVLSAAPVDLTDSIVQRHLAFLGESAALCGYVLLIAAKHFIPLVRAMFSGPSVWKVALNRMLVAVLIITPLATGIALELPLFEVFGFFLLSFFAIEFAVLDREFSQIRTARELAPQKEGGV